MRRVGAPEANKLAVQSNLANPYGRPGRDEEALRLRRDVYSGYLKLSGENGNSLVAANNYAAALLVLKRVEEAKKLLRKTLPAARRVVGESHDLTLKMRLLHGQTLYCDKDASLDDLREAVTTLEDVERTSRRLLGGAHPNVRSMEESLQQAQAVLRAREAGEN